MGFANSPTIVKNGLVYCFDPGNPKSYPGSGTTVFELSKTKTSANGTFVDNVTHTFEGGGYFNLVRAGSFPEGFDAPHIKVNDNNKTNFLAFTIDMWFATTTANASDSIYLMTIGDPNNENVTVQLYYAGPIQTYGFALYNLDDYAKPVEYLLPLTINNNWNNIILSCESIGGAFIDVSYCINGSYTTVATEEYTWPPGNPEFPIINIGHFFEKPDYEYISWQGKIGPVKLYNRALNRQEMLQNFNAHRGRYGV